MENRKEQIKKLQYMKARTEDEQLKKELDKKIKALQYNETVCK